jgi:hypothetical protein
MSYKGAPNHAKLRSHDTSRIAWAKLMARVGEAFPLECPACGGDIRLIAFITEPEETAGRSRLTSNRRFASGRRPGCHQPGLTQNSPTGKRSRKCHCTVISFD